MVTLAENPEIVKPDPRPAMYQAARARLDALRSADLPDDITPLEVLEHCRRKRLSARRVYEDMLKREVPRSDPRRIKAVVALELAEQEAELFLDRWLDVLDEGGAWKFVLETRDRWQAEATDEWSRHYFESDTLVLNNYYDDALERYEDNILDQANASEWCRHHFRRVIRAGYPGLNTYRQAIAYIEGLDYCNMEWRDAFERRKSRHGQLH